MAVQNLSLGRRFVSFLRHVKPSVTDRVRRFRDRFALPGFSTLTERQAKPIVSGLVERFRSLLDETRSQRAGGGAGMSTQFTPKLKRRHRTRLFAGTSLFGPGQTSSMLGGLVNGLRHTAHRVRLIPRRLQLESLEPRKLLTATAYIYPQAY